MINIAKQIRPLLGGAECAGMVALNHRNNHITEKTIVFSDKSTSYVDISNFVEVHVTEKSSKETTTRTLPWVHIAISNAKRTLLGIYHKIKGKYLQLYLDEFCYKLNRRYFGERLFDRLTIAMSNNYWYNNG